MVEEVRKLQAENIENIVLFVGDAVRYDSISERLTNHGSTYKTTSASLHTPASFASILTGLNVPEHGVVGFSNVIPDRIISLVDLEGWNTYFSSKTGTMHEDLHRIFKMEKNKPLSEADEPFIWIVRDPGGHAPYNGYDHDTYEQNTETGPEYLNRVAGDNRQIQQDYDAAIESSLVQFNKIIECIQERGIEDETLIVYTSDHGELLGEYGMLGHNHVACPELVYVPTTFVHPDLGSRKQEKTIRHIDLFPTLLKILGIQKPTISQLPGNPIWEKNGGIGYNHFEMVFYNNKFLNGVSNKVRSCWDGDGGHVFVESSYKDAISVYLGVLSMSYKGKQIRKEGAYIKALKQFLPGYTKYGNPNFNREKADQIIEAINRELSTAQTAELDDQTKERLDDLGYI